MAAAGILTGAIGDAEKASLFAVVIDKMRQACFVDWCVGMILLVFYGSKAYYSGSFDAADLWPAVVALFVTRMGNTITQAVRDWSYWRWHKPGETDG